MKMPVLPFLCLVIIGLATFSPVRARSADVQKKTILAHYMPWYASKPVSGAWGWHWTMDKFNPDAILGNGRREAASHDYPLIGLYDSNDPAALECQVLQMKLAGIDGVIIDWYGTRDYFDYAMLHRNTAALLPHLEKAGLKFAICYEDQSIAQMVKGGSLKESEAVDHAREVVKWVEQNWFSRESYLRHDSRPVFITFGPQHFEPDEWKQVTDAFTTDPWIHTLPHLTRKFAADGSFGWPPVSNGKALTPAEWQENLKQLYQRSEQGETVLGIAFPGFEDIYEQADLHNSYGSIAHRDGKTFAESLDLAFDSDSALIQIATWNDYGEGTVIEPTENHGYRYLEEIQRRTAPGFSADDLRQPLRLFQLRKQSKGNAKSNLNEIAQLLFAGKLEQAKLALSKSTLR